MERIEHVEEGPQRRAVARSGIWRALAGLFDYPEGDLPEAVRRGEVAQCLEDLVQGLGGGSAPDVDRQALSDAGEGDALAVEYTRLFDVGVGGPPCPLYGGLYAGDRMKTMEEAVRFYNHFGLRPAESPRELPDHLVTELEFLHFLSFREAQALGEGVETGPWCRAQRDFLRRHPGRWVPRLRGRLLEQDAMPFYRELAALLEALLEREGARLTAELGPAPEA